MTKTFYSRDDIYLLNRLKSFNDGQQDKKRQILSKTTDCLTLEPSELLLIDYNCNTNGIDNCLDDEDETLMCPFNVSAISNASSASLSHGTGTCTVTASGSAANNAGAVSCDVTTAAFSNHQRASSMYSCHSDTTTITTNTTSSDSEIDLSGLIEGLVDDETGLDDIHLDINSVKDRDAIIDENNHIFNNNGDIICDNPIPNHLQMLRPILEKDERSEQEIDIIFNYISTLEAFNKYDINQRKQLSAVIVLAIVEKCSSIILTHLEMLDSFCCLIHGQVEHIYTTNQPPKQLYPGDVFGIIEPTLDTIYFEGIMKTCTSYCWFLCVSQTDFYKIINPMHTELCKHEEDGQVVLVTEQKNVDNYRKGHIILRGTPSKLLLGLLECDSVDPFYIDDYLLTYRIFMPSAVKLTSQTGDNIKNNVTANVAKKSHSEDSPVPLAETASSLPVKQATSNVPSLLSGMDTICSKLLIWFDEQHLRDKVIRIVLTWLNSYYLDFDNVNCLNVYGQEFLSLFETKLCSTLSLTVQLRLFHVALSTKAKTRQLTITRSNRDDEVLNFSILGGYERGFGIFVSKVDEGSKAEAIGLRRGDQIIEVNGTNFTIISHARALEVLRSTTHLALTVKYNPFMFKEMISLPEGSKNKKSVTSSMHSSTSGINLNLNSPTQLKTINHNVNNNSGSAMKIKKALPKFANFLTKHFHTGNGGDDVVDCAPKVSSNITPISSPYSSTGKGLSASRSHSNPDLHSLTNGVRTPLINNQSLYDILAGQMHQITSNHQHVVRVFNASNGDSRYLLVHTETTAREVVMVSVREFGLCSQSSNGVKSSLNYSLYEVSVVPEANTVKQRRLPDQLSNLAERAALQSRYYIKENSSSSSVSVSSSNATANSGNSVTNQQQLNDDIAAEILRECPLPLHFLNLNTTQVGIQLTLQDFDIFRSIEPQEFIYDLFFDDFRLMSNTGLSSKLETIDKNINNWRQELQQFESLSNKEMFWVINEVLNETSLVKRVKIIKCFIKIGSICRGLRNYNSLFAILSGLGHGSVARLKQTWDKLSAKNMKMLKSLQKLMDPSRNMAAYRKEINHSPPPIIPFFPIVKKDLTFIHLAHSTFHCDDNLVNFEKMRMIGREVRHIVNMYSQPYSPASASNSCSMTNGIPLPPPPPTTTSLGPSATTPKRMYEDALMRKKVKHYLNAVFSSIVYDEEALLLKSMEIEGGSLPGLPTTSVASTITTSTSSASTSALSSTQKQLNKPPCQPSPTLSSTSSGSSGRLKFGAESPHQLRKLMSLSEVDSRTRNSHPAAHHTHSNHFNQSHSHHHHHHNHNIHPYQQLHQELVSSQPRNSQSHIRSVSDGQTCTSNGVLYNTVSFQSQGHLHQNFNLTAYSHQMHMQSHSYHRQVANSSSSVPLPIESSSVTSLRRLEQLQQLKKYQCSQETSISSPHHNHHRIHQHHLSHSGASLPSSTSPNSMLAGIRPPLPNYDEAVQRQHKLATLVSVTKTTPRSANVATNVNTIVVPVVGSGSVAVQSTSTTSTVSSSTTTRTNRNTKDDKVSAV